MSPDKLALCEPSKLNGAVAQQQTFLVQPPPTIPIDAQMDPLLPMDNAPSLPSVNVLPDFEQYAFAMFDDNDDDNFILNDDTCVFTNARRVEIILLKLLTELEAPLWAFQTIMDWALDAYQTGYNFLPNQKSYKSQISTLEQWVGMDHMRPNQVRVVLPGKREDDAVDITTFDFISQFHSLLSDPLLNTIDNLVVNPDDPFTQYQPPGGLLNQSLSGSWYKNAWTHMETNTECNFMIPIILYIDKTQLCLSGKLSLFPVQMSLSIFTEEARRKANAWRPLGYIANEDYFFSAAERNQNSPDVKNERFHVQLDTILASFKAAQRPRAMHGVKLQLGHASKEVNLYVPLQFIIGDVEGGDQLCSRFSYRGLACKRLCRTCDISTEDAGRTDIDCNRICVADVQELVASQNKQALRALAQRPKFNSLYTIDCGNDPYGVFSMVHTEGLHAIEVGLIPYMLEILLDDLPDRTHHTLDMLVKRLNKHPRQHGYNGFPRLLWQDGVTTITNLTGDLKVGKMFAICCVASTLEGEKFFTDNFPEGAVTWRKMLYVFQQILCYWAWLKQDHYWRSDDIAACETATTSIKIMMQQLQALWPRKEGFEWNLTKLHEQFHVPMDIHRHGKHRNVHSGPQEHNHIAQKKCAKKTQLNKRKLDEQTGERLIDRLIIQRAYDRVVPHVDSGQSLSTCQTTEAPSRNATKGKFLFRSTPHNGQFIAECVCEWERNIHEGLKLIHHEAIVALLGSTLLTEHGQIMHAGSHDQHLALDVPVFTEYERNGFVYRAHPNFRGTPYYDWAYIQWWDGDNSVTQEAMTKSIIGRILCFIKHPDGALMAVVHSCQWDTQEQHGVFGTYWHLEYNGPITAPRPQLHLVSVNAIENHVCMIPYSDDDQYRWVHIWQQSDWPGCFQSIEPPDENNLAGR